MNGLFHVATSSNIEIAMFRSGTTETEHLLGPGLVPRAYRVLALRASPRSAVTTHAFRVGTAVKATCQYRATHCRGSTPRASLSRVGVLRQRRGHGWAPSVLLCRVGITYRRHRALRFRVRCHRVVQWCRALPGDGARAPPGAHNDVNTFAVHVVDVGHSVSASR